MAAALRSKLLIVELWGLGDLVIATPFLRAVGERFDVTLLAKPFALDLQPRLWPGVKVAAFTAPWTAFENKYQLWRWPLLEMSRMRRKLGAEHFETGLSARWDPRDHLLLRILGAKSRLGFPRLGSRIFLTRPLARPEPEAHHYESWRAIARALNVQLPPRDDLPMTLSARTLSPREERGGGEPERGAAQTKAPPLPGPLLHFAEEREKKWPVGSGSPRAISEPWELPRNGTPSSPPAPPVGEKAPVARGRGTVLIHTGAGRPIRVWPLEQYQSLAARLRQEKIQTQIACDPDQRAWWLRAGEMTVATPATVAELQTLIDQAGVFVGNDSGPGHLAAVCGVPTFTIFGPQLPEWFAPLHPAAEWIAGKACPYLPCSDYCRFPTPHCIRRIGLDEVWQRVEKFVARNLARQDST